MQITSTLASVAPSVFAATTATEARTLLQDHLATSKIKDRDRMLSDIAKLPTLAALQRYTANALLKYEGLGVG